ncbi:MAG: sodium/proline symporter [Waddliaceae bacterium]
MITQIILAFFIYFGILLVIGVISHRKQTSNAEFIVGSRSLNFWLTALSAHASDMSAWLFMALPMVVYLQGLSGSWIAIGLLAGMFFNWQFVAAKLRSSTEAYDSYTLSSYFENRYEDASGTLRLITATMIIFFLTHYLAAGLTAMGLLLESIFAINYYWGLTFSTLVIVGYTFGGGFVTIAWTDLFQALFLLGAIIVVPVVAFVSLIYQGPGLQSTTIEPEYLSLLGDLSLSSVMSAILSSLAWGLGYFGMPHILTKFMGIRNVNDMKKSKYVGMSWQMLALAASISVGIVGVFFFQEGLHNPELVFVEMVKRLFPPFFAGFILCGVIAANLSTMDSQLLVCASAIGEDFFKHFGKRHTQQQLVRASRVGVIFIAMTALFIAYYKEEAIIDTILYSWAGLGSAFGPLVLTSLYDKRANKYGAIAGIVVGGTIACIWPPLNPLIFDYSIPSMIPGFFLGLLSIHFVSLATKEKNNIE